MFTIHSTADSHEVWSFQLLSQFCIRMKGTASNSSNTKC